MHKQKRQYIYIYTPNTFYIRNTIKSNMKIYLHNQDRHKNILIDGNSTVE